MGEDAAVRMQLNKIERDIGALIADGQTSKESRRDLNESVQKLVDQITPVASRVEAHEAEDNRRFQSIQDTSTRRHGENKDHLERIDASIENLTNDLNMSKGRRNTIKYLINIGIAAATAIATVLGLKGHL